MYMHLYFNEIFIYVRACELILIRKISIGIICICCENWECKFAYMSDNLAHMNIIFIANFFLFVRRWFFFFHFVNNKFIKYSRSDAQDVYRQKHRSQAKTPPKLVFKFVKCKKLHLLQQY